MHASVADNIRYFRDIDDAAVQQAARLARIHEDMFRGREGTKPLSAREPTRSQEAAAARLHRARSRRAAKHARS